MTTGSQGGPAVPVQVVSGGAAGGRALRVIATTTIPAQGIIGMPDQPVVEATDADLAAGRAFLDTSQAPIAVYARQGATTGPAGGPPLLVYVVSGSLTPGGGGAPVNAILLESGDYLTLENGNYIVQE